MSAIRSLLKKIKLLVLEAVHTKKVCIDLDKPIFSFTFDDVPLSAAYAGAEILEEVNTTGTYYVALGIKPDSDETEPFISEEDIRSLHLRGHDIQCHTFSHLNLRKHSKEQYITDCKKNRSAIIDITKQHHVSHFAYPFGLVGLSVKKILGNEYATLRTVDFGINYGVTDVTHLRAIQIFSNTIEREEIRKAIKDSSKYNAWTIFFTHDVKNDPTPWGATPEDMQWVVDECKKVDGAMLNVNDAYQIITDSKV